MVTPRQAVIQYRINKAATAGTLQNWGSSAHADRA